jgi:hypothetical protein
MAWIKHRLVPPTYDSNELLNRTTDQIRRLYQTSKQIKDCENALQDFRIAAWRKSSREGDAVNNPGIIWVTSKTHGNTISHITLKLLKTLSVSGDGSYNNQAPIILYSLDSLQDSKRTAHTLLKEVIFQLLQQVPNLLRESKTLQDLLSHKSISSLTPPHKNGEGSSQDKDISLHQLGQILQELLDSYAAFPASRQNINGGNSLSSSPPPSYSPQPSPAHSRPIFWIIDRIDTCVFKSKGYRNEPTLSEFAGVLEELVSRGWRNKGRGLGKLRVLLTSIYEPSSIDDSFRRDDDEEEEEEKKEDAGERAGFGAGEGGFQRRGKRADIWWEILFV